MTRVFLFLIAFSTIIARSQTYEILEVEISCQPKPVEGINTKGSEFCPFIYADNIYFTSSREYDMFNYGENNWKKAGYLNIFKGKIKDEGDNQYKIKGIELVSNKLVADNHTGPLCLSTTGDTMFYTQVQEVSKKNRSRKSKFRPQLYMSIKQDKKWSDPQPLPFNDDAFSFGHPTFDSKNKRLYFAADLNEGKGGKDIYYADLKDDGSWTKVKNLELINTASNEVFPCIIESFIFFASDRAGGKGGLDIYWRDLNQSESETQAVKGLNSAEDDFGLYVYPGMTKGFYSNNTSGNDDVFFLTMEKKVTVKNVLAGRFTYRNIKGSASGLKVKVIGDDDEIILETTTDKEGNFDFSNIDYDGEYHLEAVSEDELYLVIYDKDGKEAASLVSDENGSFAYKKLGFEKSGTLTIIPEDMIDLNLNQGHLSGQLIYENKPGQYPNQLNVLLVDEEGNQKFETFTDKNGNFDFRKLDMEENYILKIPEDEENQLVLLIFDKKGNVVAQLKRDPEGEFNYRKLKPSYSNSLSVIEETDEMFELDTKTISGYFEYKNLDTELGDGLKVQVFNEDGFLLTETVTDKSGKFRFRSLPIDSDLLFKVDEEDGNLELEDFTLYIFDRDGKKIAQLRRGQNDFFIFKPLGYDNSTVSTIKEDTLEFNLNIKTDYDLVLVYFDSNESNVKNSDLNKLKELYKMLKAKPELKVEVNAYADARSSDEYNLILSGKRGDWVVDYLVKKGLSKKRFIVNAYGESQLVDENNDALNRRAEIRIY